MRAGVLSYMALGAGVTVMLACATILLSSTLGMGLALVRLYAWPPLRLLAAGYTLVTRGIPLLVLLIGCYFSLPYLGLSLPVYAAAVVVMGFYFAAYLGEVFRAAIMAVPAHAMGRRPQRRLPPPAEFQHRHPAAGAPALRGAVPQHRALGGQEHVPDQRHRRMGAGVGPAARSASAPASSCRPISASPPATT